VSKASYLRRNATGRAIQRQPMCGSRARSALLFASLLGAAAACAAQDVREQVNGRLEEVVVQAKRQAADDEQITQQVQKALTDDRWIYAEHVKVTTKDGVVTVDGIVGDTGELFRILRLCRKIPGVRRVHSAIEILDWPSEGG
jgi:osmotically-inducible protein OsmY